MSIRLEYVEVGQQIKYIREKLSLRIDSVSCIINKLSAKKRKQILQPLL